MSRIARWVAVTVAALSSWVRRCTFPGTLDDVGPEPGRPLTLGGLTGLFVGGELRCTAPIFSRIRPENLLPILASDGAA
jgi:hypothetical protein